ncbi:hypothetical protein [Embleya sp. MST-111070]|uniref:hypothetical protein n=1 Tax=Embleya sp. MST-111070 TaxID=3398231 RepID=UPI003F73FA77
MSDWTWEYDPDADHVVGGLVADVRADVESLAQRLADATSVRYVDGPSDHDSGVSGIRDHAEGRLILWYMEHRRLELPPVLRVQHWPHLNDR